ncbi:MAG: T9SS type A sorting domain-containing protein, partial [Paludibacteraceae bacterium]|nr:T9SS type A sorting domain-containing protein [Paludibacteraceae bacterium]
FQKSSWWWTDFNPVYSFGEEDNIYFLNYDCCDPLSIKFSAESDTVHFKQENDSKSFMFSKYGADSIFHYALTTDYVDLKVMNADDRRGVFYLGAINASNAISWVKVPVDWDPRPDYEVSTYPSKHYVDIVKYTETYRIKPMIVGEGEIMLQDSFVRFGESTIIEIKQKSGWEIDSVCTSRGEKLIGEDGKYKIENVTGVIGVSAYLSQKTNLADEMSNTEFIYPNPADVQIYVNNGKTEFEYEIFDMRGTECLKGKSSAGCINVKALKEGQYILRIEDLLYKFQKIGK